MKKTELKRLLKPLIKECIKESILEEGVLSGIIMEVAKGIGSSPIVEQREIKVPTTPAKPVTERLAEHRKSLMDAIGKEAYNGINLFEGTTPAPASRSAEAQAGSPLGGVDPSDAGIDISGIMSIGGNKWKDLIK